jgi:FixJ family two-component response regulator
MTNLTGEASTASPAIVSSPEGDRSSSSSMRPSGSRNGANPLAAPKTNLEHSIVHIIESDEAMRASLRSVLEAAGLHVMAFPSPNGFLAAWSADQHGCLLLGIDTPGFDGVAFQADLHTAAIHLPIILMSARAELPRCVRNLKPGTVDLLVIPIEEGDLLARVAVACDKDLVRVRADHNFATLMSRYRCLTPREKQVLELVSEGLMNKQIASILDLSVITVKVHRATMMRKMRWRLLVEAVRGMDALKLHDVPPRFTTPDDSQRAYYRVPVHMTGARDSIHAGPTHSTQGPLSTTAQESR